MLQDAKFVDESSWQVKERLQCAQKRSEGTVEVKPRSLRKSREETSNSAPIDANHQSTPISDAPVRCPSDGDRVTNEVDHTRTKSANFTQFGPLLCHAGQNQ